MHQGLWNLTLIVAVIAQATTVAYIYPSRLKALINTTPIPFTFATLALGHTVDLTNVMGLWLLLAYWYGLRWLHLHARMPITLSIILALAGFCVGGGLVAPHLPLGPTAFWIGATLTWALMALLYRATPHRNESGHRSPLALPLKLLAVSAVVLTLVSIESRLRGFLTVAPMVSVVAAYETRRSLWTSCRYVPILAVALIPMMMTIRLLVPSLGLGPSIAVGWIAFLAFYLPIVLAERTNGREADSAAPQLAPQRRDGAVGVGHAQVVDEHEI